MKKTLFLEDIGLPEIKVLAINSHAKAYKLCWNINKELKYLEHKLINNDPVIDNLKKELFDVNSMLWDIENNKRRCEAENNFGWGFIQLARDVYFYNDKRAEIKRKINLHTNSDVIEEKEYTEYK